MFTFYNYIFVGDVVRFGTRHFFFAGLCPARRTPPGLPSWTRGVGHSHNERREGELYAPYIAHSGAYSAPLP